MAKNNFSCVDLKFEGRTVIKEGEKRQGTLHYMEQDETFKFVEKSLRYVQHPELHWRLLDRTKHGRININSQHVKVEFYIRHEDYQNGRELADILAAEIETMGDNLSDMNLKEEAEQCQC